MMHKLQLLLYFLKKDIKGRYAGSGLGILWTILVPLVQITLFWLIFGAIIKARPYANTTMPYIYFLLSSFFFWLAFSEGIMRASFSIVESGEIIKRISFPNIILPVTVTISAYLLNMVGFVFFIVAYSISESFSMIFLLVIPLLALQFLFSLGLGILLAALLPYIRDIGQILGHVLQGLFFLSPIIYSLESIPERLRFLFYANPLTYFVASYHRIILWKEFPDTTFLLVILVLTAGAFTGGMYVFRKLKEGFADVL